MIEVLALMLHFMKAFVIALLGLGFIAIFAYVAWTPIQQALAPKPVVPTATNGVVADFISCANNDYPVTESYPRTCRANGVTYTESTVDVNPNGCRDDISCGKGKFCNQGLCQAIDYNTGCQQDSDCQLVNQFLGWSCCYAGFCDSVNYSQDNWIAVNSEAFNQARLKYCPDSKSCGPMPACAQRLLPTDFVAACQQGVCVKTERVAPVPK
jgi:hypothetical protein